MQQHLDALRRRSRARGFTLIELMITVAIIGILAAIAYPSYSDSILKGRRAEGRAALLDLMQQQERFMTQTGAYTTSMTPFKSYSGDSPTNSAYTLSAAACGTVPLNQCVLLSATPTRAGSDPKVNVISLSSTGVKSCNGNTPTACWK